MTVSDERLYQLAYDPMMCNISKEVNECLQELVELRKNSKPKKIRNMKELKRFPTRIGVSSSPQDNTVVWNKGWKATEKGLVNG